MKIYSKYLNLQKCMLTVLMLSLGPSLTSFVVFLANKQTKQNFTKWSSVNVVVWIVSPVMAQRNSACHTFLFLSLIICDKLAFANYNCHFEWYLRLRSTNAGGQFQIRKKKKRIHSTQIWWLSVYFLWKLTRWKVSLKNSLFEIDHY